VTDQRHPPESPRRRDHDGGWFDEDPADDWGVSAPPVGREIEDDDWADGEWEDWRSPTSTGRKLAISALVVLVVLAAGAFMAWSWVQDRIDPPGPAGEQIELEIAAGSTTEDIGSLLADEGVISSATVWNYWTRLNDAGPFQAGEYTFQLNSSFDEAVTVLDGGPRPPEVDRVTIPEGLIVTEILARLADPDTGLERWSLEELTVALESGEIRSQFQPADQPSMEGMLFPETYEVADEADERTILRRLVTELDQRLTALDVENRAAALGVTPYEIVIIASMIEEETRVAAERPMVARVIYNRLEQGIPLGIDATSRYEAEISGRGREALDFSSDSPYNTRRVQGLPPTPIAAPGQASLEAALAPVEGDWIFYVLQDAQGNHFFTDSAQEFERAKQECIRLDLGCG